MWGKLFTAENGITKKIVLDFSRNKLPHSRVCISGKDVEFMTCFKYLGVQLNSRLKWSINTEAVYKKRPEPALLLEDVCPSMPATGCFYLFVIVASTIFFAVVCWGAGIKTKHANSLNRLIKTAESVVGHKRASSEEVVRDRMLAKLSLSQ